jgi:hypothetical protein
MHIILVIYLDCSPVGYDTVRSEDPAFSILYLENLKIITLAKNRKKLMLIYCRVFIAA